MSSAVAEQPKTEILLEFAPGSDQPYKVDREHGIIPHVKIIGLQSKWGHSYTTKAIKDAVPLYEGRRVEIDHHVPKGQTDFRKLADGFGEMRNVTAEPDGAYGDLHYIKSHPLAEMIAERAERFPRTIGLSHHADGEKIHHGDGSVTVDHIQNVKSVDLVYEGATTSSLFEATPTGAKPMSGEAGVDTTTDDTAAAAAQPADTTPDPADAVKQKCFAKLSEIWDSKADPAAKQRDMVAALKTFFKVHGNIQDALTDAPDDDAPEDTDDQEAAPAMIKDLQTRLAQLEADKQALAAREDARSRIAKAGLPQEEALIEAVAALPDTKRDGLLETWKKGHAQTNGAKPRSASPTASATLQEAGPAGLPKTDSKSSDKQNWIRG